MSSGKGSGAKLVVWGILGLLIVALMGFGTTNFGGSVNKVATVGDTEVEYQTYARALQTEIRALENQVGQAVSISQAEQFGLPSRVLSQLVTQAALDGETARLGLSLGDEPLREQILAEAAFQGLNGSFDPELYREALGRIGMNERDFEEDLRADAGRALLTGSLVTGLTMPPSYGKAVVQWLAEERTVSTATLTAADLTEGTPIASEADIQSHYDANPELYTAPETRKVTYAWITPVMLEDKVDLDEEALRRIYDDNLSYYIQPERRLVERLVFGSEADAQAAADRIEKGDTSFEDEVTARGLSLIDADMGDVSEAELGAAGETVFALDGLGVVGPLASDLGPALFRVNGTLEGSETSFEDARPEIAAAMSADAAARQISSQLDTFDDLLASGATLEELADETDMVLGQIDWTPQSEGGIAAYSDFQQAVQAADPSDFPEIIELSDGGVFALRLDEIVAPTLRPLAEVKADVARDWETAKLSELLRDKASAFESDVAAGANISELGLLSENFENLTRRDFIDSMPEGFIDAVFAPSLAAGGTSLIQDETRVVIVKIEAVTAPEASEENEAIAQSYIQQAAQGVSQDVIAAFTRALQAREGVSINDAALTAVHSQMQ